MAITVTPTVDAANTPPRVRLDVSASAGETSTTVIRNNADGTTAPVRTTDGNPLPLSAGAALIYDYEPAYGTAVSFSSLESPGTVSAQVTVPASSVWLIHPGVPAASVPVTLRRGSLVGATYAVKRGVFEPMGRKNSVVFTDGARHSAADQIVVGCSSFDQFDALMAVLGDASTLLLNIPADRGWRFPTCYVDFGDAKVSSPTGLVVDTYADVTLPFTVADRPVGGSQSQRTWADVVASNATWAAVVAKYPTWADVLAGP